jgi:hypothetical protein
MMAEAQKRFFPEKTPSIAASVPSAAALVL